MSAKFLESSPQAQEYVLRVQNLARSLNPLNLLLSNQQIRAEQELLKKLEKQVVRTSEEQRAYLRAKARVQSAIHPDTDEIIPRAFRFCTYIPTNVPITLGFLVGSPQYFVYWHVVCQAINAGINFGNRNAETPLTKAQVAMGFLSSVVSATLVVTMLKGRIARIVGSSGMMANLVVNTTACSIAAYVNTNCIRYGETLQGCRVYADPEMTRELGVSRKAAWNAVQFTAVSRILNSMSSLMAPALFCHFAKRLTAGPYKKYRTLAYSVAIALSLGMVTPVCLGIFPSKLSMDGRKLEKEFGSYQQVHFNKGS